MTNFDKKTAVILFNLGGPDRLESVQNFLFNLFNDKAIIAFPQPLRFFLAKFIASRRAKKAQKIYAQMGGKSPLLEISQAQAHAIERELSFSGNFKVFVVMRYWHPRAKEVVKKILEYGPDQTILLPLYPQFSSTTTGSSIKEFIQNFSAKLRNFEKKIITKIICCYPTEPEFIKSHSLLLKQTLMKIYDGDLKKFRFLFSAHGLPMKVINAGDPYVFQVEKTANKIVKNFSELLALSEKKSAEEIAQEIDFHICYQSKVGPLAWTAPSLEQEISRAALDKKIPVIVPISFVSDHSETLVELDIDYKKMAQSLGVKNYLRVPSLNLDGHFIKGLVEICKSVNSQSEQKFFSAREAIRICPKKFTLCPNPNPCQA
jgi:ferrochelatase